MNQPQKPCEPRWFGVSFLHLSVISKSPRGLLLAFLFLSLGCGSPRKTPHGETPISEESHRELETIAILGTNDIHGTLAPQILMSRETKGHKPVEYQAAGGAVLSSYVQILHSEFGKHFIWLDAGDEFQGSIESNLEKGAPMVQFFNATGLTAAAVGNHEFDFGIDALESRMHEAKYFYLAANIEEKGTGKPAVFPNTFPHKIITAGKLKVGVFGLSTLDTPKTTRAENVKNLKFEDLRKTTLEESRKLRQMGAQIIVLAAHAGSKCSPGHVSSGRMMRKASDPQGECGRTDELVQLLESIPPGTVDAVVSGHTHQIVHHWIGGTPVIQGGAFGRYLNVIYLSYDSAQGKVVPEQTRIEGPVPVCAQIFQNQNDCDGDRPAPKNGRGPLVPVKFHGEVIRPNSKMESLLEPYIRKSEIEKSRVLGTAARPIEHIRMGESPLGNLVADAIRKITHADVSLINSGGIRAPLEQGPITYGDLFRAIPFDNRISLLQVTGRELMLLLRVAESGSRGFPAVSGVRLRLIDPAYRAPWTDLNGDGKDDDWKVNRLIAGTLANGQPIEPKKMYRLATINFLVTGGDDLGWPISKIPANHISDTGIVLREAIVQYIQDAGVLNSEAHPLVDPSQPRLKFEKPPSQETPKKHHRHRHRRSS